MSDFFSVIDDLVKASQQGQEQQPSRKTNRWKYCVALAAKGWKAYECRRVYGEDHYCDDVIVKWRKEGEKEIEIRLSFTEQCLWLEYMEQKEKQKQ